ncbi:MAG: carbohydrate binding family 9 domain-containing protein [Myxococcota bacterium]|nr:carbohydrate binding family 9 domain-containing protein [Myxococcota bacterium]
MITVSGCGQWYLPILGLIFLNLSSSYADTGQTNEPSKRIIASRIDNHKIQLDGKLLESEWSGAQVSSNFVERVPNPGDQPPVTTDVRVLFDDHRIYVAVDCAMTPGEQPRILELRRDSGRIWADDAITLKFDVTHDKRTSINFGVNAADAQVDGIALNNGRQFRKEFDAVWQSASYIGENRWTVEYAIPYVALGLTASDEMDRIIGFNVSRDHNSRNATYDWTLIAPEYGPSAASEYGDIVGLKNVGIKGQPVRIAPYLLMRAPGQDNWSGHDGDIRVGLDAKTRLHNDLWMELTALTDFAEVDLDDPLVNLSRFPLFLPEKRPFFLSGLSIFEFGARGRAQPFFSRRIGLDSNTETIPIWAGAKLYGRVDQLGVGLLNVTTAANAEQSTQNHSVARLRHVFDGGNTAGVIATSSNELGGDGGSSGRHSVGIDGSLSLIENRLEVSTFIDLSIHPDDEQSIGNASQLGIDYRGRIWQPSLFVTRVDENYEPALGFVRRRDIVDIEAVSQWTARYTTGLLSRIQIEAYNNTVTDEGLADYLGRSSGLVTGFRTRTGWSLVSGLSHEEDIVDDEFDLPTGEIVDAGSYSGLSAFMRLRTPWIRNPNVSVSYDWTNGFYGGYKHGIRLGSGLNLGPHFRFTTSIYATLFKLPQFDQSETMTVNCGLTTAFSSTLFWENNLQGVSVDESGRILSRIRWRYLPGSDLFLVYQEDIKHTDSFESQDRRFVFKLTYWWDAVL